MPFRQGALALRLLMMFLGLGLGLAQALATAETHRLQPTVGYPPFAAREPVLTVKPGDVLVVSQVAVVRVANMVDPLYTVVAKFPKRQLPAR